MGSTRLWAADAEAMSASLRIHDQIFKDAFSKFDGYIFATALPVGGTGAVSHLLSYSTEE